MTVSKLLRPVLLCLAVVAAAAGGGLLAGWLWWTWWSPAPLGQIQALRDGTFAWYAGRPLPSDPLVAHMTEATLQYVAVGFGVAVLLGIVAGLLGRNRALLTLGVLALSTALSAYLMYAFGVHFSPPDPQQWADRAHYGRVFPGNLAVSGWTPYLAWPVGALLGFAGVMLSFSGDRSLSLPYASETVEAPADTPVESSAG